MIRPKSIFQLSRRILIVFVIGFTTLCSPASYALVPDAGAMIQNIADSIPDLMQFVTALAYVLGMWFIIKGIVALKQHGEMRSQSATTSIKSALTYMGVGGALIFLPTTVQVGLSTFWSHPNPYAYLEELSDPWWEFSKAMFMILELIGAIALIRGLVMLTHAGGQNAQPGVMGKAIAHIVGGILCINMFDLLQTVKNTIGIG